MGKRKQLKDGDVVMGGADPSVEGDESDEVHSHSVVRECDSDNDRLLTDPEYRRWTL